MNFYCEYRTVVVAFSAGFAWYATVSIGNVKVSSIKANSRAFTINAFFPIKTSAIKPKQLSASCLCYSHKTILTSCHLYCSSLYPVLSEQSSTLCVKCSKWRFVAFASGVNKLSIFTQPNARSCTCIFSLPKLFDKLHRTYLPHTDLGIFT